MVQCWRAHQEKAGIYVLEPDAKRVKAQLATVIKTPEDPTNVTFGGKKRDVLYITTAASLFRIQTVTPTTARSTSAGGVRRAGLCSLRPLEAPL
jgi:sugar lactone lactonase YvrE